MALCTKGKEIREIHSVTCSSTLPNMDTALITGKEGGEEGRRERERGGDGYNNFRGGDSYKNSNPSLQ